MGLDENNLPYNINADTAAGAVAKAVSSTSKGVNYNFTQHFLMVGAYRGKINNIPGFQDGGTNQLKDSELAKYVGLDGTYITTTFTTTTRFWFVVVFKQTTVAPVPPVGQHHVYGAAALLAIVGSRALDERRPLRLDGCVTRGAWPC